jgi:chromosome partitioning protein
MSVICVGGTKGGGGKSTVATNLAAIRASAGRNVLLVNADVQDTAADFTAHRSEQKGSAGYDFVALSGEGLHKEVQKMRHRYRDIVIDAGGQDTESQRSAISAADLLLVPFVPSNPDMWTLDKVLALVGEAREKANPSLLVATFLNRAETRGQENEQAAAMLQEFPQIKFCPCRLGRRKAFQEAMGRGLAVTELQPENEKASAEMLALYHYVFDTALKVTPRKGRSHETHTQASA